MLDSVQHYVCNLLNGLTLPAATPGPLTAYISPPALEKLDAPRAYVWGGQLKGRRQTAPRGPGMMRLNWTVTVWLVYMDTPDDALANEPFPGVFDTVLKRFMTTTMPLWIDATGTPVGPNAGSPSDTQIQAIGESFDADYPPERLVNKMRQSWYTSRLGIDVMEVVQA